MQSAGIKTGKLFRKVSSAGKPWGEGVTEKLVWHVVKEFAKRIGNDNLAPHDLRRTCARLCRAAGGELEQIQFLLGRVSVQTTERYLGCTQRNCCRRKRQNWNRGNILSLRELRKGGPRLFRRWRQSLPRFLHHVHVVVGSANTVRLNLLYPSSIRERETVGWTRESRLV